MKIKPLGFYVLVEMDTIESVSDGGIVIPKNTVIKEQDGCDFGTVRAIGPVAYAGLPGCASAEDWGVKVGDRVEYRRYEGKRSNAPDMENFRYIPDSHIVGVIDG